MGWNTKGILEVKPSVALLHRSMIAPALERSSQHPLVRSVVCERVFRKHPFRMGELRLTDPPAIHALAHPVRIAILDILRDREIATATDCAARVDESVQSCAYHLRTLAKWGLVEEAPGPDGRERPWRLRVSGFSMPKLQAASSQFDAAWAELRSQLVARDIDLLRRYLEDQGSFTNEEHRASTLRNVTLHATAHELERLADEVSALMAPYRRQAKAERPKGAERVHAVFWLIPHKNADGP
jgi:DNA-binding transcriptional ArsR family regulator